MNKKRVSVFAALAVAACVLTGCGGKDAKTPEEEVYVNEDVVAFVEERVAAVDYMSASYGEEMDVTINAEGDAVVFTFQNNTKMSKDEQDAAVEQMETAFMEEDGSYFRTALDDLRAETSEEAYIIVRYLDADGNQLVSHDIK